MAGRDEAQSMPQQLQPGSCSQPNHDSPSPSLTQSPAPGRARGESTRPLPDEADKSVMRGRTLAALAQASGPSMKANVSHQTSVGIFQVPIAMTEKQWDGKGGGGGAVSADGAGKWSSTHGRTGDVAAIVQLDGRRSSVLLGVHRGHVWEEERR